MGAVFFAGRWSALPPEQDSDAPLTSAALVAQVRELIDLPTDEEPTVLTIRDMAPLQGQPFFDGAKVGDKFLIFAKAKKAILYDAVARRIIQAGPYSVTQ